MQTYWIGQIITTDEELDGLLPGATIETRDGRSAYCDRPGGWMVNIPSAATLTARREGPRLPAILLGAQLAQTRR